MLLQAFLVYPSSKGLHIYKHSPNIKVYVVPLVLVNLRRFSGTSASFSHAQSQEKVSFRRHVQSIIIFSKPAHLTLLLL